MARFEITEDVSEKLLRFFLQTGSRTAEQTASITASLLELAQKTHASAKDKFIMENGGELKVQDFLKLIKNQSDLRMVNIPDEDVERFKEMLTNRGVPFCTMSNADDVTTFIYHIKDEEKVIECETVLTAEAGLISELTPSVFAKEYEYQDIEVVRNLDPVEVELFRHYAKKEQIVFSVFQDKDAPAGTIAMAVAFLPKAQEQVKEVLHNISADLAGEQGEIVREQIEYRISGRQQIGIAITDAEQETYIINKNDPSNFIKIDIETDKFQYYKRNHLISEWDRNDAEKTFGLVNGFSEAVVLNRDDFESDRLQDIIREQTAIFPDEYSVADGNACLTASVAFIDMLASCLDNTNGVHTMNRGAKASITFPKSPEAFASITGVIKDSGGIVKPIAYGFDSTECPDFDKYFTPHLAGSDPSRISAYEQKFEIERLKSKDHTLGDEINSAKEQVDRTQQKDRNVAKSR